MTKLATTVGSAVQALRRLGRRPRRNPVAERRTVDYGELRAMMSAENGCE